MKAKRVTGHACTPDAMQIGIKAGVNCIKHGNMADEETVKLMAEKIIGWSLQPFLEDEDSIPFVEGWKGLQEYGEAGVSWR